MARRRPRSSSSRWPGTWGSCLPEEAFLKALQTVPRAHGALLINDEIITGFRLRYGLSGLLSEADIVCLGKVIGGGLPVGALGGRVELMSLLAPDGPVYQAGTLSGNPLVMAAGVATLDTLCDGKAYARITKLAGHLENGLGTAVRRSEAGACVVRRGSLLSLFFRSGAAAQLHRGHDLRHGDIRAIPPGDAGARGDAAPIAVRGVVRLGGAHGG